MTPKVSCLCPTFYRSDLLGEAVESFLRQDYAGESELVILNDAPHQELILRHPRIRVVNTSTRFPSLGAKRNHAASLATGELLLTWGDDDIHLPHRISRMVRAIGKTPMVLEGWHYILLGNGVKLNRFATTGAHIIRKDFYQSIGGVPELDTGEDAGLNIKAKERLGRDLPSCCDPPAFVYRWHSPRPHISAFHNHKGEEGAYEVMQSRANTLIAEGSEPTGRVSICPHWKEDYTRIVIEKRIP